MTEDGVWVTRGTLTLPYGTLATLHEGQCEVRLKQNILSGERRVFKLVSLLGREDSVAFNEVVLLQGIVHDNVARVFDVAEVAGGDNALRLAEIIMPYYPSGSIFDAMERGVRFSAGEARDIMVRALRGLGHLHDQHRILHRDPKPANLFLSGDETLVKVGDLGEAVRMGADGTADPLISPQFWTPPESFCGGRYTVAADIYGMGMSMAELLSGTFPYDDYTRERLANNLEAGRPAVSARDLSFAPHVPEALRRIVRKATRRNADGRYQAAREMVDSLLNAQFIDWAWPETDTSDYVWLGQLRGTEFRVSVRSVRGKGWRATSECRFPKGWRRIQGLGDRDAGNWAEAAKAAFSQIEAHRFKD